MTIKVGYLGPRGSFSEEAVFKYDKEAEAVPFQTIDEIFEALGKKEIGKGVLPVENSFEGAINSTIDNLILEEKLCIENELLLKIKHCLLGPKGSCLKKIQTIYSHPQALAQCRKFLKEFKKEFISCNSTAEASQLVAEKNNLSLAAIAGERAATLYGLEILKSDLQESKNNVTRFLVVGRRENKRSGRDKTAIVFITKNEPGSLVRILEVFDVLGINMTCIISRPSKKLLGEYSFFVEIEGHQEEKILKVAFDRIRKKSDNLRVLGSYPRVS